MNKRQEQERSQSLDNPPAAEAPRASPPTLRNPEVGKKLADLIRRYPSKGNDRKPWNAAETLRPSITDETVIRAREECKHKLEEQARRLIRRLDRPALK